MENKGCAFEMKGGRASRYFTSPAVKGLADFVRFLYENRGDVGHAPRPIPKRIPQLAALSEKDWHEIADSNDSGYSCFFIIDIPQNEFWVNEDIGDGMAIYCFPFTAVMEVAISGGADVWERLLTQFPGAKKS